MKTSQAESLSTMQMLERMFQAEMAFMESEPKDICILANAFHPNVVVHEPTSLPYAGDWIGLEGIAGLMQKMSREFSNVSVEDLNYAGQDANHITGKGHGVAPRQHRCALPRPRKKNPQDWYGQADKLYTRPNAT